MAQNAPLHFLNFNIIKVIFDRPAEVTDGPFGVNVQHLSKIDNLDKSNFVSEFIITLSDEKSTFNLQVQAIAGFKILGEVDESIYKNYTTISAPSIVYPYIRAFIANMLIQTGMKHIVIPTVNFSGIPLAPAPEGQKSIE